MIVPLCVIFVKSFVFFFVLKKTTKLKLCDCVMFF